MENNGRSYNGYSLNYDYKAKRIWFKLVDTKDYSALKETLPKILMVLYPNVLSASVSDAKSKAGVQKDFVSQEEIDRTKSDEFMDMVIRQNMIDLNKNRKPCGFNYLIHPKIIFPIIKEGEPLEFYLETHKTNLKRTEKWCLVDRISNILLRDGFDFEILEDLAEKKIANLKGLEKII